MSRITARGYFDSADDAYSRNDTKRTLSLQRTEDYLNGYYEMAGGVLDPVPDDAPSFVKEYNDYYKKKRGYHPRSVNSTDGWKKTGLISYMNYPMLHYLDELKSAVLMIHGEEAHSFYMAQDVYAEMTKSPYNAENKEFLTIPGAVHVDLYDNTDVIPFDKIAEFFKKSFFSLY